MCSAACGKWWSHQILIGFLIHAPTFFKVSVINRCKFCFLKQKFASCSTNSKKFWDTVNSMENKITSSHLPTALRLGNTVTTDISTIIENFNKNFSTAGHAFLLATPAKANCSAPPDATCPSLPSFSFTQI